MKWVEVGQSIGYARTVYAKRRTLVGIIPFGWGDGLFRNVANRGSVLAKGKRCPIIGLLHVEHCLIDLTEVKGATVGDEVVLLGEQEKEVITLREHAVWAGANEVEIWIQFGRTIPRIYFKGGQPVAY